MTIRLVTFLLITAILVSCAHRKEKISVITEWKQIDNKWYLVDKNDSKIYTDGYDSIATKEFIFDLFFEEGLLLQDYKIFKSIFEDSNELEGQDSSWHGTKPYLEIKNLSNRTKVYEKTNNVFKAGLVSGNKLIIPAKYYNVNTNHWSENIIIVARIEEPDKEMEALYDTLGNLLLPFKYSLLYYLGQNNFIANYNVMHEKKGIINLSGDIVCPFIYDDIIKLSRDSLRLEKDREVTYLKI